MMAIAMIAVFVVNLPLGLPPFPCLLLTALVGFPFADPASLANTLPQRFFGGMNIFSLMAIPLFVLAGNLMSHFGMTSRLTRLTNALVGHFRGSLDHINVIAGVFFAGANGSAAADASALSTLLVPAMEKEGYLRHLVAGLTADSSLIGLITPSSILMILYSSLTNTSVGELFLVEAISGLLLAAAFMLLNAVYAYRNGLQVRHATPAWGEIPATLPGALTALIAPVTIVAGIVLGLVTPIESGVLIALYVAPVDLLQHQLSLVGLWNSLCETVRLTASTYVIIAAASVVNWLLNHIQVASEFIQLPEPSGHSPTLMLFIISVVIFVCGTPMEEVLALMLLTSIVAPVALTAGVDSVYLGLIFTLDITIAPITPPMGACLFIVAAISRLDILETFKSIWSPILLALGVLLLLILFPPLILWLPRLLN